MPDTSLYLEFANATAVARARLWPSWARLYPALERDRWYRVWDVGQDEHGAYLDVDGGLRLVSRHHIQLAQLPST